MYTFLAYDKIGNGTLVKHEVKNIDKTEPLLKLKSEPADNGNVKIMWEMSDYQSGIRNIILPNGKSSSESKGTFIAKENGDYTFIAYDNVGNDQKVTLKINNIDKTPIVFQLYAESIDKGTTRIHWLVDDTGQDFARIILPNNTASDQRKGFIDVSVTGEYTFLAYDMAGNESKGTIRVEI